MHCIICLQGYIVLNRPWAFVQWLEKTKIEEEWDVLYYVNCDLSFLFYFFAIIKYDLVARLLVQICVNGRA